MKLTLPEGKTPVSHLQELCSKWGIVPAYEQTALKGPIHDPVFEYSVTARDYVAYGRGNTKKQAKHSAAQSLLDIVGKIVGGSTVEQAEVTLHSSQHNCNESSSNPVGQLQELIQKQRWPPPIYEFTNEHGPLHARSHICTVHMFDMVVTGSGSSKRLAKKAAAEAVLQRLQTSGQLSVTSASESAHALVDLQPRQPDRELVQCVQNMQLHDRIATLTPQKSREINDWYQLMKLRTGKTLASLQMLSLNLPSTNYCQMLAEIADEQGFSTTYRTVDELTDDGRYQCTVQLTDIPAVVCYSTGLTAADAQSLAAHNALQYLKIMTRKA